MPPAPSSRLVATLTLSGTLPFLAAAGVAVTVPHLWPRVLSFETWTGQIAAAAVVYGAVIASFLCGMHWGLYLAGSKAIRPNLFVESNICALIAWCAVGLGALSLTASFASLALLFGWLLWTDYRRLGADVLGASFLKVRLTATAIVVSALVVLAVCSL